MKFARLFIPPLFSALMALSQPAAAQEAVPLPPSGGMTGNAGMVPESAVPAPSLSDATSADDRRACKHVVNIEDIPYTWDKLEKGTDAAWVAYSKGEYTRSVPVFERLAEIGHPVAQRLMGIAYYYGQGVPLDLRTALIWFEKAANQGCFEAYAPTAQMYENGDGTPIDLGKTYMWYNIAISKLSQGNERRDLIKRREQVAALLTPAQLEAAQKRSLQFSPKLVTPPDISELPDDFFKQP